MLVTIIIVIAVALFLIASIVTVCLYENYAGWAAAVFTSACTVVVAAILWVVIAYNTAPEIQRGNYILTNINGVQVTSVDGEIFNITKTFRRSFTEGTMIKIVSTAPASGGIVWESVDYYLTPVKDGKALAEAKCFTVYTRGPKREP